MSIQGIRAGKAFVEFFIDDKRVDSGLAKISKKMSSWGRTGLAASSAVLGAFAGAAATFANVGSELNDMSQRTGLTVESLSELSFAAKQTGTDMGVVEKATKALQANGIDPLKFDEILNDLAAIPDHTERAKQAMEIFGAKVGTQLLPMTNDLQQLRAEAQRLGVVMSAEDAAAADALGDAFDASKAQFVALVAQIGAAVAGPLTQFLQWTQGVLVNIIAFVHEHPILVQSIAAIALAFAVASTAAIVFGAILAIISAHPIIAALSLILGLLVGIASYFGFGSSAATKFSSSLSAIKVPGVGLAGRFASPQLQPAVSSSAGARAAGVSNQGGDPAVGFLQDIVGYTRRTAELLATGSFGFKLAAT